MPAQARALFRLSLLALSLAACKDGNRGATFGPPESSVVIDMNGTWMVSDVERLDSNAPLPTASPIAAPLFPLAAGQIVPIGNGLAYGYDNLPLFSNYGGVDPTRYANAADGRTFVLEVETAWLTSCSSTLALRAAFSPNDLDTMTGYVQVNYASDCSPSFLDNRPNGLFAVRLVRVAIQAAGEAASGR